MKRRNCLGSTGLLVLFFFLSVAKADAQRANPADDSPGRAPSYTPPDYAPSQPAGRGSGAFKVGSDPYNMKALHERAEAIKRQMEQNQAEQRRRDAASLGQRLIQQQLQQNQQVQDSFNELANRVGEILRDNSASDSDVESEEDEGEEYEPLNRDADGEQTGDLVERSSQSGGNVYYDRSSQQHRTRQGSPVPIITYRKPDGTVDYSGIPVEAVDPSAQVNVYYRAVNRGGADGQSTPPPSEPYVPPQRLSAFIDFSRKNTGAELGRSVPDNQQDSDVSNVSSSAGVRLGNVAAISNELFGTPTRPSDGSSKPKAGRGWSPSQSANELFGQVKEVAHATGRTLTDELFGQIKNGDELDLKEAAKSGINNKLDQMKDEGSEILDARIRQLIKRLPEDERFDYATYYNTFISPKTSVTTPFQAKENLERYFEETVGTDLESFFGKSPSR